ncbi:DUF6766 family protein [Isoptericola variabilis]|uniref:Uncharacterized protein n=1 Tax=Isoptericola variabilis (strain 225) TaxID=743718 RepID=F6FRS4_ISOV2|nr:DUF6766 family protein [Isoptericola variabilis]AEG43925.1 hypothetical protein Isova_1155 [Isoptericola variabilis 225]TWH30517.1 hypothetical protein L600_000300000700 [Isoptericola variabilis J7]
MSAAQARGGSLLKENGLSLFFAAIFLASMTGQAFVGTAYFNREQLSGGLEPVGVGDYVLSSSYWVDITENWQSEFLQFLLFIVATVWFVQKGSPESKELEKAGRESDKDQKVGRHVQEDSPTWARAGGWKLSVYSHSLAIVMGAIFVGSWFAQSVAGAVAYSEEQLRNLQDPVTWTQYLALPEFWSRTIQNWQSEFLAVLAMVVLSIYLRERGSPESKPVGSAHQATGIQG